MYLFLQWTNRKGLLTRYGVENQSIGQLKSSFSHYCHEQFATWLHELKIACKTCPIANWVYKHLYIGCER